MIDAGQVTICCHSGDIGTSMKDNDNGNDNINATDIGDDDDLDQVEEGVEVEAPGPAMRPGDGYTWSRQVLPHLLTIIINNITIRLGVKKNPVKKGSG